MNKSITFKKIIIIQIKIKKISKVKNNKNNKIFIILNETKYTCIKSKIAKIKKKFKKIIQFKVQII